MKNCIKNKNFCFPRELYKIEKILETKLFILRIYTNLLQAIFYQTRSFRFNCKKRYQNIKYRKYKKMLGNKIVRFKKIHKLVFFIIFH